MYLFETVNSLPQLNFLVTGGGGGFGDIYGGGRSGGGDHGSYGFGGDRNGGSLGSGLRNLNWKDANLPVFEKNFYIEHPSVSKKSEQDAQNWRRENNIIINVSIN